MRFRVRFDSAAQRPLRAFAVNLSFFLLALSAQSKTLFHSDFERGETYLARTLKPGAKSIELVPNFRLEEWPVSGGEGIVEGNLPSQAEAFRYTLREGSILNGVSGITKPHEQWAPIQTGNCGEWRAPKVVPGLAEPKTAFYASHDGAMFGAYSGRIDYRQKENPKLMVKIPNMPDRVFCRFYVTFTRLGFARAGYAEMPFSYLASNPNSSPRVSLLHGKRTAITTFGFCREQEKSWRIMEETKADPITGRVEPDRRYCIEYSVQWLGDSAVHMQLWVDGGFCAMQKIRYISKGQNKGYLSLGNSSFPVDAEILVDEVVVSDSAIGPFPQAPKIHFDGAMLHARRRDAARVFPWTAIQWQVSSINSWLKPLFNSGPLETDRKASGYAIPMPFTIHLRDSMGQRIRIEKPM